MHSVDFQHDLLSSQPAYDGDLSGRELKVVTGDWFLEQRSKRFSQGNMPSSDMVKQIILTNPPGED